MSLDRPRLAILGCAPPLQYTDEELRAICEEAIARGKAIEQAERQHAMLRIRRVVSETAQFAWALLTMAKWTLNGGYPGL